MPPAQPNRRCIIIGSGVTGIAAVQAIREVDASADITLISADRHGYYSRPGLAYLLTGETSEAILFPYSKKDLQKLNVRWLTAQVSRVLPAEHQVVLESGAALTYDRLLIATGAQAAPLKIPGADLRGVFKLDHLDDARAILAYISPAHIRRARTAVVTGGGITALELAEGLRAQGMRVHYLLRGDRYWSNVLDETESRMVEARLAYEGVQIHFGTELVEIFGRKGQVSGVRPREGEPMACDMVAFAIGVRPRLELAAAAGLRIERGILVDEMMRTSEPDIFAAGDVAQVFDPLSGQSVLDTLWNTARDQGRAAGLNMARAEAASTQSAAYRKNVPINITRLGGLTTTIIGMVGKGVDPSLAGIARGDSETWRQLPVHSVVESHRSDSRLRLLISDNRLLGAVVMGDQAISLQLQELISSAADITPIRSVLLHTTQPSEIITAFWKNWRSSNHAEPQP